MTPDSITYHYTVKGEWDAIAKSYTKIRFQPDHLSFSVHVNHDTGAAKVTNIHVSGARILKDGNLSFKNGVHESFYSYESAPEFAKNYFDEALRQVRYASALH